MKATIDPHVCTGCELCASICPEVFEMDGLTAWVAVDPPPTEQERNIREAAQSCPAQAIAVLT